MKYPSAPRRSGVLFERDIQFVRARARPDRVDEIVAVALEAHHRARGMTLAGRFARDLSAALPLTAQPDLDEGIKVMVATTSIHHTGTCSGPSRSTPTTSPGSSRRPTRSADVWATN